MRGKWDRNLKPKLAIMRQCATVTDRLTLAQLSWYIKLKIRLASEQHDSLFGGKHSIASALGAKIQLCYCDFFSKAVIVMMVVTVTCFITFDQESIMLCVLHI